VGGALIIGTDSAIYAYTGELDKLADYGVPQGRAFTRMPSDDDEGAEKIKIFSKRGVCEAMPFKNLTERRALFAPGSQCSTAIVAQNGIHKFIALSDGSGAPYTASNQ
jgi:hypothetical protein